MKQSNDRIFTSSRRVRVSDCDQEGKVRIDAIARYLQDIGFDDTNDIGVGDGGLWVARKIEIEFPDTSSWPKRNEMIKLETYCGGVGGASAERIVKISSGKEEIVASTIWVHVDRNGKPDKVPGWLSTAYPKAKKIKAPKSGKSESDFSGAKKIRFPIRQSDFDVNGHVNNAVSFVALNEAGAEIGASAPLELEVQYLSPISNTENIELLIEQNDNGFEARLISDNTIACSMKWISTT